MRQAWQIFQKDVLYLYREIAIYLGALLAAWWLTKYDVAVTEALVTFAGAYLIARLIHADAAAGDRQFWITRPYRWHSLLGAKVLFILTLVDLPVCIAQWAILAKESFTLPNVWRGLLWEQFLILGVALSFAALAALTRGMVPFIATAIVTEGIVIGISYIVQRPEFSLHESEWVRSSLGFIVLVAVTAVVLCLQYNGRHTSRSRQVAFGLATIGVAAYIFVPWSLAFAIQQRFSKQPFDPASIHISLNPELEKWGMAMSRGKRVQIAIPMVLTGLSKDALPVLEALQVTIRGPDERESRLKPAAFLGLKYTANQSPDLAVTASSELDRDYFNSERDHPVTLRGSLFLTLFGNRRSYVASLSRGVASVEGPDQLRCFVTQYGMACTSPLRPPRQWVEMDVGVRIPLNNSISYSPFPASLGFFPFDRRWASAPLRAYIPAPESTPKYATVHVMEPVAYIRRDFEITGLPLTDIAVPWRAQRVSRGGKSTQEAEY
jgi:hypothetical protein